MDQPGDPYERIVARWLGERGQAGAQQVASLFPRRWFPLLTVTTVSVNTHSEISVAHHTDEAYRGSAFDEVLFAGPGAAQPRYGK